jgi:hypothetical protein
MNNLGGWIISFIGLMLALWSIYSVIESKKKEKHG